MPHDLAPIIERLERYIATATPADVPEIIGALARLDAVARFRIATADSSNGDTGPRGAEPERFLTAAEVGERLGVSAKWAYEHQAELGATKLSPRCVRFSERKVVRYLKTRRA